MAASAGSADSGHEPPLWEVSAFAVSPPSLSVLATLFSGVLKARSHRAPPFAGLVPRPAVSVDEAARIGAQAQLVEDQAAFWWRRPASAVRGLGVRWRSPFEEWEHE